MTNTKRPCVYFLRGTCHFGHACNFSHEVASLANKKDLCRIFAKGNCDLGDNCRYSHDTALLRTSESRAGEGGQKKTSGPTIYDQFIEWRYDIKLDKRDIRRAQPLGDRLPKFIQQALSLVNVVDTQQDVIACLSSEGGLERLAELFNVDYNSLSDGRLRIIFQDQVLPFMQIVSHDAVISSAVLESKYATILNYLYGINGKRSVAVFNAAIRATNHNEESSVNLEPCLIALSAVLEVNGSAYINDDLRAVAETMIALTDERELSGKSLRYYKKMCLRLGLGDHIEIAESKRKDTSSLPKPQFKLSVDQPGNLSEHGPRHDNDFEDIENIQILPTLEEILSDRAEYLPRTDPSTRHWPGVDGLLDRQFRLLREDTVGQLRDAAKIELIRIQDPHDKRVLTRDTGARTYSYGNVDLVHAEFDEHKGLLCVLQVAQPRELQGKTATKRKEWWDESNRLSPDALIVLLGADQVAIFLTVANTVRPPG